MKIIILYTFQFQHLRWALFMGSDSATITCSDLAGSLRDVKLLQPMSGHEPRPNLFTYFVGDSGGRWQITADSVVLGVGCVVCYGGFFLYVSYAFQWAGSGMTFFCEENLCFFCNES